MADVNIETKGEGAVDGLLGRHYPNGFHSDKPWFRIIDGEQD